MQRVGPLVRPPLLRAFPVHADAIQARRRIEPVTLVRPPAVDAEIEDALVMRPVAADAALVGPRALREVAVGVGRAAAPLGRRARIVDRAGQMASLDHDVQHDLVVERVEIVDRLLRIREDVLLPLELAVVRVPARRTEVGAEIDQRVARQLLLAHRLRDPHDFVGARERAMRLLVAERPQRRHLGQPGDARVLAHDRRRILRDDEEAVERQRRAAVRRRALRPRRSNGAERLVDEERPAVGADQPLDRHAAAVRAQLVAALPVPHRVDDAAAIELRASFAEPEERRLAGEELKRRRRRRARVPEPACPDASATRTVTGAPVTRDAEVADGCAAGADGGAPLVKRRQRAVAVQIGCRPRGTIDEAQRHRRQRAAAAPRPACHRPTSGSPCASASMRSTAVAPAIPILFSASGGSWAHGLLLRAEGEHRPRLVVLAGLQDRRREVLLVRRVREVLRLQAERRCAARRRARPCP